MSDASNRSGRAGKFVLGAKRYEKISAVEGIALTPAMKQRAEEATKTKASPDEYREAIIAAYRKN